MKKVAPARSVASARRRVWSTLYATVGMRWWCPNKVRCSLLRASGASIAGSVLIRPRVRVEEPANLVVGENCWIGEGATVLNPYRVRLGANVCVSQDALVCSGFLTGRGIEGAPIEVREGAWIALRATIGPGVTVGGGAVVGASAAALEDVPEKSFVV